MSIVLFLIVQLVILIINFILIKLTTSYCAKLEFDEYKLWFNTIYILLMILIIYLIYLIFKIRSIALICETLDIEKFKEFKED